MTSNALPVLIARAGRSVTIDNSEFDDMAARYGGRNRLVIVMERIDRPGPVGEETRLTLANKATGQGDLPA